MGTSGLVDRLKTRLEDDFTSIDTASPTDLFHYTTGLGLMGILDTKKIWATHYRYVNDFAEFDYGREIALKVIREMRTGINHIFVELMLDRMLQFVQAESAVVNYYVACFCGKDDLLSQWRGYASSGIGYSIHLKSTSTLIELKDLIHYPSSGSGGSFTDLDYCLVQLDYKDHSGCIRDLLKIGDAHVREQCTNIDSTADFRDAPLAGRGVFSGTSGRCSQVAIRAAEDVFQALMQAILRMKTRGFEQEYEWRIVVIDWDDDPKKFDRDFRVSNGILIPYLKCDFLKVMGHKLFEIESIRCGPSRYPEYSENAVGMLLRKCGFPDTKVTSSAITLKG